MLFQHRQMWDPKFDGKKGFVGRFLAFLLADSATVRGSSSLSTE